MMVIITVAKAMLFFRVCIHEWNFRREMEKTAFYFHIWREMIIVIILKYKWLLVRSHTHTHTHMYLGFSCTGRNIQNTTAHVEPW